MKHLIWCLLLISTPCTARFVTIRHREQLHYFSAYTAAAACAVYGLYHLSSSPLIAPVSLATSTLCAAYGTYRTLTQTTPRRIHATAAHLTSRYTSLISHPTSITAGIEAVHAGVLKRSWRQWLITRSLGVSNTLTPLHVALMVIKEDVKLLRYYEDYCKDEDLVELYEPLHALRTTLETWVRTCTDSPEYREEQQRITAYLETHLFKRLLPFSL